MKIAIAAMMLGLAAACAASLGQTTTAPATQPTAMDVPAEIAALKKQIALLDAKLTEANKVLNSPELLRKRLGELELKGPTTDAATSIKTFYSLESMFKDYPREQLPTRGQGLDRLKASLFNEWLEKNLEGHQAALGVIFDYAGKPTPAAQLIHGAMSKRDRREAMKAAEGKTFIPVEFASQKLVLNGSDFDVQVSAYADEKQMPLILKLKEGARGQVSGKIGEVQAWEGDGRRPFRIRIILTDVTLK